MERKEKKQKEKLTLVFNGHVDCGKSTTAGHLYTQLEKYTERTLQKFEVDSLSIGKGSFKYAWFFDRLKEERERALTIDMHVRSFSTENFDFTVIDTPGHRCFVKNMITGASQGDVSLLVVSAQQGEFEVGIDSGGQTREHALITFTFGVKQLIVLVNKMDSVMVKYSEERFNHVKLEVSKLLKTIGYNPSNVVFIPISGWVGENLTKKSPNMTWYKGPTLLEALNNLSPRKQQEQAAQQPLRFIIRDVFKVSGIGIVPVGRVVSGRVKPGMEVNFAPHEEHFSGKIFSIERHHCAQEEGVVGDQLGLNLLQKCLSFHYRELKRGDVIGNVSHDPPKPCESFEARVIILNHPGKIFEGYTPIMYCHGGNVPCKIEQIIAKIDKKTGKTLQERPQFIKKGESALVRMVPMGSFCVEKYSEYGPLGRFLCRDLNCVVLVGVVNSVVKKGERRLVKSAVRATRNKT